MKSKNMKKLISGFSALAIIGTLAVGAFSYFTDYQTANIEATAGTLEVTLSDLSDIDGTDNILNPGDANALTFTATNEGQKSADVKAVINLTATDSSGAALALSTADPQYKLLDKDGNEITTGAAVEVKDNTVTYMVDDITLNGTIETETGVSATTHTYEYKLAMDADAKNEWQGSSVDVSVELYAKQHRNSQDVSDWISVVEK